MATMYPNNIESYNPTQSERDVYYAFKNQLSDEYIVFYSLRWMYEINGVRDRSEADFLIFNKRYGFITIEVKGGSSIKVEDGKWFVVDQYRERQLKKSPYDQAESSMYYIKNYFEEQVNYRYTGVYGYAVMFPYYHLDNYSILSNRPNEITIDFKDMNNLDIKVENIFLYWKNDRHDTIWFSEEQKQKFIKIINKKISLTHAAGALIQYKNAQLDIINRVQDNYIYMLSNFRRLYLKGGAGTGKTWIGIKLALKKCKEGKRVLFTFTNKNLVNMIKEQLEGFNVDILDLETLLKSKANIDIDKLNSSNILNAAESVINISNKYDVLIVDEAQDFTEEYAFLIRYFLIEPDDSEIYVLYDNTQNLYSRTFGDQFCINVPPFLLHENLRNTSSIYNWATQKTNLGKEVVSNPIEGSVPETIKIRDKIELVKRLELILNELIIKECVSNKSITVLYYDDLNIDKLLVNRSIAQWKLVYDKVNGDDEILMSNVTNFKGKESDVVIYITKEDSNNKFDYVAYTRARFYLYEIII